MEWLTLLVISVTSVMIWTSRPAVGLAMHMGMICLYPQYLALSIGQLDVTSGRIVVLVLLLRVFRSPLDPAILRIRWMDVWVAFSFAGTVIALFTTETAARVVEREGGRFLDTVLAYAAARLILRTRDDVYTVIRGLVIVGLPLAVVGAFQSFTGYNPYGWLRGYSPWDLTEQEMRIRHGFYRADGSFGNKIPFGLFFAMLLCLNVATYFSGRNKLPMFYPIQGLLFIGLMSAMSSAPWFSLVASGLFIILFPFRRAWPYLVILIVTVCSVIEVASDLHFYEVLVRFALNSNTAWYRIFLMEEAFGGGMSGHWITGYGYVGFRPEEYGHNGFRWVYADLVSFYIYKLATTGLVGLCPYLILNAYYYWCLYRAGRVATTLNDRWTIWCISAGLVGWNVAMLTIGALDQTNNLFYVLIAVAGASRAVFQPESGAELSDNTARPKLLPGASLGPPVRQS